MATVANTARKRPQGLVIEPGIGGDIQEQAIRRGTQLVSLEDFPAPEEAGNAYLQTYARTQQEVEQTQTDFLSTMERIQGDIDASYARMDEAATNMGRASSLPPRLARLFSFFDSDYNVGAQEAAITRETHRIAQNADRARLAETARNIALQGSESRLNMMATFFEVATQYEDLGRRRASQAMAEEQFRMSQESHGWARDQAAREAERFGWARGDQRWVESERRWVEEQRRVQGMDIEQLREAFMNAPEDDPMRGIYQTTYYERMLQEGQVADQTLRNEMIGLSQMALDEVQALAEDPDYEFPQLAEENINSRLQLALTTRQLMNAVANQDLDMEERMQAKQLADLDISTVQAAIAGMEENGTSVVDIPVDGVIDPATGEQATVRLTMADARTMLTQSIQASQEMAQMETGVRIAQATIENMRDQSEMMLQNLNRLTGGVVPNSLMLAQQRRLTAIEAAMATGDYERAQTEATGLIDDIQATTDRLLEGMDPARQQTTRYFMDVGEWNTPMASEHLILNVPPLPGSIQDPALQNSFDTLINRIQELSGGQEMDFTGEGGEEGEDGEPTMQEFFTMLNGRRRTAREVATLAMDPATRQTMIQQHSGEIMVNWSVQVIDRLRRADPRFGALINVTDEQLEAEGRSLQVTDLAHSLLETGPNGELVFNRGKFLTQLMVGDLNARRTGTLTDVPMAQRFIQAMNSGPMFQQWYNQYRQGLPMDDAAFLTALTGVGGQPVVQQVMATSANMYQRIPEFEQAANEVIMQWVQEDNAAQALTGTRPHGTTPDMATFNSAIQPDASGNMIPPIMNTMDPRTMPAMTGIPHVQPNTAPGYQFLQPNITPGFRPSVTFENVMPPAPTLRSGR